MELFRRPATVGKIAVQSLGFRLNISPEFFLNKKDRKMLKCNYFNLDGRQQSANFAGISSLIRKKVVEMELFQTGSKTYTKSSFNGPQGFV